MLFHMVPMDLIGIRVINIIPFITNIFHIIPYCPCCSNGFNRIFHYNKWKKDLYSNGYYSMDYDEWIFIGLFQWIFYYKPFSYWGYHGNPEPPTSPKPRALMMLAEVEGAERTATLGWKTTCHGAVGKCKFWIILG